MLLQCNYITNVGIIITLKESISTIEASRSGLLPLVASFSQWSYPKPQGLAPFEADCSLWSHPLRSCLTQSPLKTSVPDVFAFAFSSPH